MQSKVMFPDRLLADYTYTFFSPPANYSSCISQDINNSGKIVGSCVLQSNPDHYDGFILANGIYTMYSMPNAVRTELYNINDNDEIFGWYTSTSGGNQTPFPLINGNVSSLPFPTFCNGLFSPYVFGGDSYMRGFKNSRQIVGYCKYTDNGTNTVHSRSFVYNNGIYALLTDSTNSATFNYAISNNGQIVG